MIEEETTTLKTIDNKLIKVPKDILKKCRLLDGLIEDEDYKIIYLKEVDGNALENILKYLNHYKDFEPKDFIKPFPEFADAHFFRSILNDDCTFDFLMEMTIEEAINTVNAANYLQIHGLIDILAARLGYELNNCSVEEAKKKFQIEDDMTEEEKAEYDKYPLN